MLDAFDIHFRNLGILTSPCVFLAVNKHDLGSYILCKYKVYCIIWKKNNPLIHVFISITKNCQFQSIKNESL